MKNRRCAGNGKRLLAGWLCVVLFVVSIMPSGFQVRAAEVGVENGSEQDIAGEMQEEDVTDDVDGDNASESDGENTDSADENNNDAENEGDRQEGDSDGNGEENRTEDESGNESDKTDETGEEQTGNKEENTDEENDGEGGSEGSDDDGGNGDSIGNDGEDSEGTDDLEDEGIPDQAVEGIGEEKEADLDELLAVSAEERLRLMSSEGDIASGISNDIVWVIDGSGKLTVTGTGDFDSSGITSGLSPWHTNREKIQCAQINVSEMRDASNMFENCNNMQSVDLSNFNTDSLTNISSMFWGCESLQSVDLSNFDTESVENMSYMFYKCKSLKNLDLSNFNAANVKWQGMSGIFCECTNIENIDLSNFATTNEALSTSYMFEGCENLKSLNLSSFNTGNVINMSHMFDGCKSLKILDLSNFYTGNVTNMSRMFSMCATLESIDLSNFDTRNATDMSQMFSCCFALENIDLSNFDTSNVTDMSGMFWACSALENIDLSNFDTGNVTDMTETFYNCRNLNNLNVSSFDTTHVISMSRMFNGCSSLQNIDVSRFSTSNVTDMLAMFRGCSALTSLDLSNFNFIMATEDRFPDSSGEMLMGCTGLTTIYSPYNLKYSVVLPANSSDIWYRSDGTVVTELPQNLSYSVALGKNHIPKEKEEPVSQLAGGKINLFLFRDAMTGTPIKDGRVCIEEKFSGTNYYYPSAENGYVSVPLSKNCSRVFISTYFSGYEGIGGWTDLNNYRTESGIYVFDLKPRKDKYIPKWPFVKASVRTSAPDVETDKGSIGLFNMDLGFDLDFGKGVKSTVTYDEKDRTIKVAISTDGKASYDTIKKEYKASGSKSGKSLDEEFENAEKKMSSGRFANVNVEMTVKGYLEFAESGAFIEGGAIVRVKGSGTTEYRPVCTAGLAYAKFEIGLSTEGKLLFTYVDGNLDTSAVITLEPYAKIAVGAGWSLAHAEIGATGKLPVKIDIPYISDEESLSIDADLELYGEVKFFCFGGKHTEKINENIWPAICPVNYTAFNEESMNIAFDDLQVLPRNYLSSGNSGGIYMPNTKKVQNTQQQNNLTLSDSFRYSEISEDLGVFEENNVQYVSLADGTEILAWIHDFGDKSSVNRTTLVYSINQNDGNGWSSPVPVCSDTSTGDYYPDMTAEGNKAYIVWNKASKEFDDNVTADEAGRNMDVYVSIYENGAFTEPVMISESDNGLTEFKPIVAVRGNSAAAAWLINSENDYHYTRGSNAVYVSEYNGSTWGEPVCYAQNLHYISDYDLDWFNGNPVVLYAEDADNRSDTQDGTVYFVRNGNKTVVGDSSYHAEIVDLCNGAIYFSGGNRVYKAYINSPSRIYDTGIATDNFAVVRSAAGDEAILFLQQDGFASNICASYLKDGTYTSPIPLIADGSRVTNYSPVYHEDGMISIAYNEDEITETSEYIYGLTDMVVRKHMEPDVFSVEPVLVYNAYDVAPGNMIEFAVAVYNGSTQPVSQVNVSLTGSSEGEVYTGALDVCIAAGERQYVRIPYTMPGNIVNQNYTLTVTPVDYADADLSDNSAVCELGFSDIAFSDLQIKGDQISGTVTNIGCQTAENVSLTMRKDNQENSPFATLSYGGGNLGAGESWEFSQEIEPEVFQNVGDIKYYLLSASTDSQENDYSNNSEVIYDEPIVPTIISLAQDKLSLPEKTTAVIQAEVLPENATFKEVVYASDDNSVAVVDRRGNVYAVGEGQAVITVYTMDGSLSAQCEVTVEKTEEELYTLSERELELETGEESLLCVTDINGDNAEGVTWTSTDEDVVTIDQAGNVAAKGEGIACLVAVKEAYTDVCIVRVSDHSILQLACEESTLRLTEGETSQLQITVIPEDTDMDKTLVYVSEENTVATVDTAGNVTAVSAGSTTITISSVNGVSTRISVIVDAPVTYTVVFDPVGGTKVDSVEVTADRTITEEDEVYIGYLSSVPSTYKAGYIFTGWYIDKSGTGDILAAGTPITGDVVYYAGWRQGSGEDDPDAILPEDVPEGGIPENFWIAGVDPQGYPYTGKVVKPQVRVYDGDRRLKEGQDYTVSYKNNTKANDASVAAKAPTITVKGKGNYSGTETATFKILPVDLNDENVITSDITTAYNKKQQKKVPTLTYAGKKLVNKRDFTVSYPALEQGVTDAYKAAGSYDIVITAKEGGNFTGKRTVKLIITDHILISNAKVSRIPDQRYTGDELKPALTVTYKKAVLEEDRDYTVAYIDNVEQGRAVVTLTGIGQYAGEKKVTFNIKGTSLTGAKVIGIENKEYNGEDQKQAFTVTLNNVILTEGTDYETTYSNNRNAGKAGVVIKGINAYSGTVKKSFKITAYDIKMDNHNMLQGLEDEIIAKYVKGGARPKLSLTFNGQRLVEGKDYIVSYKNNTAVTTEKSKKPSITIKGKGNFKGALTKSFTIISKDLNDKDMAVTMSVADKSFINMAGKYISKPVLTDIDGKKLVIGKDYEKEIIYSLEDGTVLTSKSIVPVGSKIKVNVVGKGSYYGRLEATYRITKGDFSKAKIEITPQIYSGSPVTLGQEDLTVKVGRETLTYGVDYEIVDSSYKNNKNKGTASVTIIGKGAYGGTRNAVFKITAKRFIWFWRLW